MTPSVERSRRAYLIVGLILPVAVIIASTIIAALWIPEIPDPAVTHWGPTGPDGFGPRWSLLWLIFGVGGGIVALLAVFVLLGARAGGARRTAWSQTTRFLGALGFAIAVMLSYIGLVSIGVQRGLARATDAPDITLAMLVGFVILLVATAIGWFVQPVAPAPSPTRADDAVALEVSDTERVVWIGTAMLSRTGLAVTLGALGVLVGLAAFAALAPHLLSVWPLLGATAAVAVCFVAGFAYRVRASAAGLRVHSFVGWPRIDIPASEITGIRVIDVVPLGDFGGWGYRWGVDGRTGIVLRRGEGIEVTRRHRGVFVLTIADAATVAAVLRTAAERAAS